MTKYKSFSYVRESIQTFESFHQEEDDTINLIQDFMISKQRSTWIESDIMNLFIRKSLYLIEGKMRSFIDLASVTIFEEGQGHFTSLIKNLIKTYPNKNIYAQNILNPIVQHILNKFGFKVDEKNSSDECVIMYLLQNDEVIDII